MLINTAMTMRSVSAPVLLLCCGLLAGCAGSTVPQDASFKILAAPYQLDSGDQLRVTVFEQANLSATYTVDQAGFVTIPLVGPVAARGRTTQQLAKNVAQKLQQGFVRDPDVSIEVATFRPFFIHGEVNNAGQFQYVSGLTAQTAIAIAGGFSARANKRSIVITRQINGNIQHGVVDLNTPIRPGDTIMVKERLF